MRIIRFRNEEVISELDNILKKIKSEVMTPISGSTPFREAVSKLSFWKGGYN